MQQVLINLVINAFDAMRNSRVAAAKSCHHGAKWREHNFASVRDYGVWYFRRSTRSTLRALFHYQSARVGDGPGIVRSIVESHGGTVTVENVAGGGCPVPLLFR